MTSSPTYRFRLYVAGDGPHSVQAISNLREICCDHLLGRHEIEVIDVTDEPQRALNDRVILTPMLLKLSPAPIRKLVGTLRDRESVLQTLGILEP